MPLRFGFSQQRQCLAVDLWRRLAFLLSGTFRLSDRHQEFRLLSCQFTTAGLPAAFPDLGEIFADLAR